MTAEKEQNQSEQLSPCPSCGGILEPDSEYPDDLLCGFCEYVFDRETLDFVEAFGL